MLIQRQIPMLRLTHYRFTTTNSTLGINQICRRKWCTALLALVTISTFRMTMRTFSGDITVCKKLFRFLVIILFGSLFQKFALIIKRFKELRCRIMVCLGRRTGINIKRNSKFLKRLFNKAMISIYNILRSYSFFTRTNGNGHSMFIRTSDKKDIFFFQTEIADIDISRNIHTGKMTNMHRTISVRQCRSHSRSFKFLFHIECWIIFFL